MFAEEIFWLVARMNFLCNGEIELLFKEMLINRMSAVFPWFLLTLFELLVESEAAAAAPTTFVHRTTISGS